MKRLVTLGLIILSSVTMVGCVSTDKKEPAKTVIEEDSLSESDTKDIKGIRFDIDGSQLTFPKDFTRSHLLGEGFTPTKSFEQGVVNTDEELEIDYGKLKVYYYPENFIVTNVDSMSMTGFYLNCNTVDKIVMDGIDLKTQPDGTESNKFTYETDDYTVTAVYTDGKLESIRLKVNSSKDYFKATDEVDFLNSFVYDEAYASDGGIRYSINGESFVYPDDNLPRVLSLPVIPYKIGFTGDYPKVCVDINGSEKGILLDEVGMEVNDLVKVGGSFLELQKEVGMSENYDVTCIELKSDKSQGKIYVQANNGKITDIALTK